jgi:hypothetical protein
MLSQEWCLLRHHHHHHPHHHRVYSNNIIIIIIGITITTVQYMFQKLQSTKSIAQFWKIIFNNILRNAAANAYAVNTHAASANYKLMQC